MASSGRVRPIRQCRRLERSTRSATRSSNTTTPWWDSGWPSLALGRHGKPWVAWAEFLDYPDEVNDRWSVYSRKLEDQRWVEIDTGSASGGGLTDGWGQFPSMAVHSDGAAWIAWNYN